MLEYELTILNTTIQNDFYDEIVGNLEVSDFTTVETKAIFSAIQILYRQNKSIDMLMLQNEVMKKYEDWDESYLTYLNDYNTDVDKLDDYINLVKDTGLKRRLKVFLEGYGLQARTDKKHTGKEILDQVTTEIDKLNESSSSEVSSTIEILYQVKADIEKRCDSELSEEERLKVVGVPTSFIELDEKVIAFAGGELIVIGSRPSMGKTTLVSNILRRNAVNLGIKSCFFSCEMTKKQIVENMLCAESGIATSQMRRGNMDFEKLLKGFENLLQTQIFIDDTSNISVSEIKTKTRLLMKKHDIKLIGIDYIQLMKPTTRHFNREQQIAEISRGLKSIAKQLDIPIIALCQLNKEVEKRTWVKDNSGKKRPPKPRMSDTRESEAIFNDCDIGLLLQRDYYYTGEDEDKNKAEIIIGKNRNLPIGSVIIGAELKYLRFANLGEIEQKSTKSNLYNVEEPEDNPLPDF